MELVTSNILILLDQIKWCLHWLWAKWLHSNNLLVKEKVDLSFIIQKTVNILSKLSHKENFTLCAKYYKNTLGISKTILKLWCQEYLVFIKLHKLQKRITKKTIEWLFICLLWIIFSTQKIKSQTDMI